MGAAGVATLTLGGFFGFWAADQLHRWSVTLPAGTTATTTPALPAGFASVDVYNQFVVDARPTWKSFAWQGGLALVSFVLGGVVKPTWAKLLLVGAGVGSVVHMAWQGVNHFVMIPLFGTTAWGVRAYAHEIQSNNNIHPAPASTTPATGTAGLGAPPVRQMAAPPVRVLPAGQPARMPTPIATAARPFSAAPVRSAAPSPAGTHAAPYGRLGQNGSYTPPAGMSLVANLANGNCPDGSTTVANPDNADMPFCLVPTLATPTPPAAAPPPVSMAPSPPAPTFMAPPPASPAPPPTAGPPAFTSPPAAPSPPMACAPCLSPSQQVASQLAAATASGLLSGAMPLPGSGNAAPCCGSAPCSCGAQQMGSPPGADGPRHPMFQNLLAPSRRGRIAA